MGKERVLGRLGSCLRRNDGKGRGMTEEEAAWVVWGGSAIVRRSRPRTPHLASPLEGGRDELGKERCWTGVGRPLAAVGGPLDPPGVGGGLGQQLWVRFAGAVAGEGEFGAAAF